MPYQLASADVLPDTDTAGDSQRYSFPLQVQGGRGGRGQMGDSQRYSFPLQVQGGRARGRGGADVRFVRYPG